jgi:hypothetical protein
MIAGMLNSYCPDCAGQSAITGIAKGDPNSSSWLVHHGAAQ